MTLTLHTLQDLLDEAKGSSDVPSKNFHKLCDRKLDLGELLSSAAEVPEWKSRLIQPNVFFHNMMPSARGACDFVEHDLVHAYARPRGTRCRVVLYDNLRAAWLRCQYAPDPDEQLHLVALPSRAIYPAEMQGFWEITSAAMWAFEQEGKRTRTTWYGQDMLCIESAPSLVGGRQLFFSGGPAHGSSYVRPLDNKGYPELSAVETVSYKTVVNDFNSYAELYDTDADNPGGSAVVFARKSVGAKWVRWLHEHLGE